MTRGGSQRHRKKTNIVLEGLNKPLKSPVLIVGTDFENETSGIRANAKHSSTSFGMFLYETLCNNYFMN